MNETVVLVPGTGFGGAELFVLAWQLRRTGYRVKIFWKNPWRCSLSASSEALHQMLEALQAEAPHLVAHSLGGLVVLQTLRDFPQRKVGRIVLLGTPLNGSLAARRVLRVPGGRWVLGEALASSCAKQDLPLPSDSQVGAIAGRFNFLLGFALCPRKPNDTLVSTEETWLPGLADHCVLAVSHTSMLFSMQVCRRVVRFLREGRFSANGGPH